MTDRPGIQGHPLSIGRISQIAFALLVGAAILTWPALLNRGAFFIPDTSAYVRSADAAMHLAFGVTTPWSDKLDGLTQTVRQEEIVSQADGGNASAKGTPRSRIIHPPLLGRSIFFGALIYLPIVLLGELAAVYVQCLLIASVIWLSLKPGSARAPPRARFTGFLVVCLALSLLTGVAFVGSLLVPDFLTGVMVLSFALLACCWDHYRPVERTFLAATIVFAVLSHTSNLPLLLALAVGGFLLRAVGRKIFAPALVIGMIGCLAGPASEYVYKEAVRATLGTAPIRPPFLTARLISDGPGIKLIDEHCDELAFVVCRYRERLPYDSDLFLWSTDARTGVFSATGFGEQRKLSSEDSAFALATVGHYPLDTLGTSLRAFLRQLTLMDLRLWKGPPATATGEATGAWSNLPPDVRRRMLQTRNARGDMPIQPFQALCIAAAVASLLIGGGFLLKNLRSRDDEVAWMVTMFIIILGGIVINALITGTLSKPDSRYSLRVLWTLPLLAMMIAPVLLRRLSDKKDAQSAA